MRITLDISAATQQNAGIARYEVELIRALQAANRGHSLTGFYNRQAGTRVPDALASLSTRSVGLGNRIWRLRLLAAYGLHRKLDGTVGRTDVFHGCDYIAPPLHAPVVITVHDLSFRLLPQYHTRFNHWYLSLAVPLSARAARAVVVDSKHTRRDLIEWLRLPEERVHAIPLGVAAAYRRVEDPAEIVAVKRRYNLPEEYLFFIGTLEPRKNLVTLLAAYRRLREEGFRLGLVLAGGQGWRGEELARAVEGAEGVVRTGLVAEGDLPALYSGAGAFVMPSWYEGFGLPVLEAMACGTPVVSSNAASLREVAGEAALLVEPGDVGGFAQALRTLLTDEGLRAELIRRGHAHAAGFTWEAAAQRTLDLYEHLS